MTAKQQCPFCRKHELVLVSNSRFKTDKDKYKTKAEYRCNKCERTIRVLEKEVKLEAQLS